MKCGNCGGEDFEVTTGVCHCTNCGATVSNEVAAAIHAGFPTDEETDSAS